LSTGVSDEYLTRILKKGISKQEINKMFGEPVWGEVRTDGTVDLVYSWAVPSAYGARVESIGGVSVQLTNNLLISWQAIHARVDAAIGATKQYSGSSNRAVLSTGNSYNTDVKMALYIVSDEPIDGGTFVDTARLPRLGYIRPSADLEIKHLQAISLDEYPTVDLNSGHTGSASADKSVARLSVVLTAQDASAFYTLTVQNVGKRILVTLDDEPLAAPLLMQPIKTGELQITIKDSSTAEKIDRQLKGSAK
jgi:hypothetical protein